MGDAFGFLNQVLGQQDPIVGLIPSALSFISNKGAQGIQKQQLAQNAPLTKAQAAYYGAQTSAIPAETDIKKMLANAKLLQASNSGQTGFEKTLGAFNQSLANDQQAGKLSPTTQALGAMVRKLMTSSTGTTITNTPNGGTTVQLGGPAQLPSIQTPQTLNTTQGNVPQGTEDNQGSSGVQTPQQNFDANSLLFPTTETSAQIADQKQLGSDIKDINSASVTASQGAIPTYNSLLSSLDQLGKLPNPITGHLLNYTPEGQEFLANLARARSAYFQQFKNVRTQREFNQIVAAIGSGTMYPSALKSIFTKALDSANQDTSKAAFYNNYLKQGGNSASDALSQWSNASNPHTAINLNDKYTNFNVPGTNYTYKEFAQAAQKNDVPISRLISEAKRRNI